MPYKDPKKQRETVRRSQAKLRARMGHDPVKNRLWISRAQGKRSGSHRFIGVDGEGWTDVNGQHHYMALVIGEDVLYTGEPLTTRQCLDFMLDHPDTPGTFKVGFFFDYDVTMILRDIITENPDVLAEIVNPSGDNYRKTIRWGEYRISYIPRKRITVRRYGNDQSRIVIHDTRAFFQMSFVKALETYGITGNELPHASGLYEIDQIRAMKAERATFSPDNARQIIRYCKMECRLLAELMGEVRDRFAGAKLDASPYEGPGPVAGKVLKSHGFKDSEDLLTRDDARFARRAYYGGRFEISAHGTIPVPVYEYDIKSAYPWAMTRLPCLEHGVWTWERVKAYAGDIDGLWCGYVTWDLRLDAGHDRPGRFGPLPFRMPDARIHYPLAGSGVYWSIEIPPSFYVDDKILRYHQTCNCQPFAWVAEMFAERAAMEAERKGSGIALKLVLNSMYGKIAQRVGARPYFNSVWSGLITAHTRTRIRRVYDQGADVLMFATDAVFVTNPLHKLGLFDKTMVYGDGLGEWEHAGTYDHLTIFQPGVYFDQEQAKFKTRGVPMREIRERAPEFIAAANTPSGEVSMRMSNHLGIRQCLAWGPTRYADLGNWLDAPRTMRVDPTMKRRLIDGWTIDPATGIQQSWPILGHPDNVSTPYDVVAGEMDVDDATNLWEEGLHDIDDYDGDSGGWHAASVTTKPSTHDGNNGQ